MGFDPTDNDVTVGDEKDACVGGTFSFDAVLGFVSADSGGAEISSEMSLEVGNDLIRLVEYDNVGSCLMVVLGELELVIGELDGPVGAHAAAERSLAGTVVVTHLVSQCAPEVGRALILDVNGSSILLLIAGDMSVVGTADQLHLVPAADAEDASAVHVDGVGAPDERGMQHFSYSASPGKTASPHCLSALCFCPHH